MQGPWVVLTLAWSVEEFCVPDLKFIAEEVSTLAALTCMMRGPSYTWVKPGRFGSLFVLGVPLHYLTIARLAILFCATPLLGDRLQRQVFSAMPPLVRSGFGLR